MNECHCPTPQVTELLSEVRVELGPHAVSELEEEIIKLRRALAAMHAQEVSPLHTLHFWMDGRRAKTTGLESAACEQPFLLGFAHSSSVLQACTLGLPATVVALF